MTSTITAPLVVGDVRPRVKPVEHSAKTRRLDEDRTVPDIVDVWGHDSFPASDPPANW